LPRPARITPMREHQRYFPLACKAGRLLPLFVAVANGPREDMDVVRRGSEKVLAARLADARFFYDEDRKTPLADYVPRLKDVVFQERLGTVYEKVERVWAMAASLARIADADEEVEDVVERAVYLSKDYLVKQMM